MSNKGKAVPVQDFIELVKDQGKVWASPSHSMKHKDGEMSHAAILEWQYDKCLYSITVTGKRIDVLNMPAFHLFDIHRMEYV